MQTRPSFKSLIAKVSKAFFRHPDQHLTPATPPDFKPKVKQKKSKGGRVKFAIRNPHQHAWRKLFSGIACPPYQA